MFTSTNSLISKEQIACWDDNAIAWNELMAEGSEFQVQIVDQALSKLLPSLSPKNKVLELGCGNGFLARRIACMGADVHAIDSSSSMIELAKRRTPTELAKLIHYQVADVTQREVFDKFQSEFDCAICNMALMDISDIHELFRGTANTLKPNGIFVVTQTHPCFEKAVGPMFHEMEEENGTTSHKHGIKVWRYLKSFSILVKAVPTLPSEHLFYHRSLSTLFQTAFQNGFVVDGLEEIAFPNNPDLTEHNGWHLLQDVPVIIGIRFRKLN